MQLYTSDKTSPRSFPWLWYIRLVALVITLIVLGITVANTATFHSIGCDAPARLLYNLAVSALSLIALIYFILASGPSRATRLLPWFVVGQLALDALIFVCWLSAAATSSYSCTDLCNVCGILEGYVDFDSQSCICYEDLSLKRDFSQKPGNMLQSRSRHSNSTAIGSIAAKQAFDAVMTVIFAIFIAADIIWIIKSRKTGTSTAPASANGPPMKNEEAGLPMGGVGAPTYTQQPNPEYSSQTAPQGSYPGQPMQNQGGPPQHPMTQEQYPGGQYPQGQTQYPQDHTHYLQDQNQYPQNYPQYRNQTSYPQDHQIPSPQGEYSPQYGGPAPHQTSYPWPRDGISEMHSPNDVPKVDESHHV